MMKNSCFAFRPFNVGGCFEFKLPNGKTMLVDPYFPDDGKGVGKDKEVVEACDYILLTHTHFDHDMHVGYFSEKFHPKVFVQADAAIETMIFHKIPIDNIIPVNHGQEFELDGFKLQGYMTKHASFGLRKWDPDKDITLTKFGLPGHKKLDAYGDVQCVNYLIAFDNGFTTAIVSGTDFSCDIQKKATEHHIDLLIRQFGMRKGPQTSGDSHGVDFNSQIPPEEFADVIAKYHAQIMIPFHFENTLKHWGEERLKAYVDAVTEEMSHRYPGRVMFYPEAYTWYHVGLDISKG